MQAKIEKKGNTIIVHVNGKIDHESQLVLKENLIELSKKARTDTVPNKFIFDLENLEFVGSSGITSFMQSLKEFNSSAQIKPKYCNVKSEFRKIIQAFDNEELFEIFESTDSAYKSMDN